MIALLTTRLALFGYAAFLLGLSAALLLACLDAYGRLALGLPVIGIGKREGEYERSVRI